ncbi:MAG: UDP-N-acetylglucosamine--N-acetylmuramyl-(pentapeptide) pyrophosphoryl-undecaprenol N-acetylglucosamine transferase [Elusimicrobiota bacterium]|jgi:UDP-N-acetylglucosamine--N-acetylmuramyl-(pentapeptide) pyrophosphoryl-undecaprenol N-acetylglucosamine transferase|nr:UDP-N-acetylglucosamine--N-acetylmuramyl-(pentapeptide) pyrophosphoryl-undecaprenol N-acetylglucosamine transferase [Elusimicrobiota bacterium]
MENVFLIAAGGTGGHFYPGLALGKELISRGRGVVFVIDRGSPAAKLLDSEDISYCTADFAPAPRGKNPFKWAAFAWKLFLSVLRMRRAVRDYKPLVCVGMGGYVSFPLILAAHYMGVKTALHDSNAKIGLANRICAKWADLFMLGLPTEDKPPRAALTGTPVREAFRAREAQEEKNYWQFATDFKINILVFGGSQGARNLNLAAAEMARGFLQKTRRLHFLHITGRRDYEEIKKLYNGAEDAEVIAYSEDIHALMKAAHLVISRAGASSAAEIISLKKPSVLVPYPYASDNHQYYNAKVLADRGCAALVEDGPDLAPRLGAAVKQLLSTPKALRAMADNFDKAALPDPLSAAARCADLVEKLASSRTRGN